MPNFTFTARDADGAIQSGVIQAETLDEATKLLRAGGKYPTSVKPVGAVSSRTESRHAGIKVGRDEVIGIATQIGVMLETGVNLADSLECCVSNTSKPATRRLLDDVCKQVHAGVDFSTALARHPRSFPKIFVALILASERSGMMSKMLNRAVQYLKDEQEIRRKVKGAITYPAIMFGFALLTTTFLLIFVLPKFTTIYANKGAALPGPTKVLMALSNGLVNHWMWIVPVICCTLAAVSVYFRTAGGRRTRDWLSIRLPLIGPMLRTLHLSRGLRTIGTMATSGVSLVDCVDTAQHLCTNSYYSDLWTDVQNQIQNGKPFSEPLSRSKLVPGAVARMIASGEKGGKLGMVTEQVATFAEHDLKEKITEVTRYIEPAMIMGMGVLIGGVTLALLLPIFSISKVVAH